MDRKQELSILIQSVKQQIHVSSGHLLEYNVGQDQLNLEEFMRLTDVLKNYVQEYNK
jgi:hypothetical protein